AGIVLFVLGGWVVSLCLHEFGHAFVAHRGGDHEVRLRGYLTLDPRRYTDPLLSIVLPLLFLAIGGLPLPGGAVLINHYALRSRTVESLVSLAGPLINLLLGLLLSLAVAVVPMPFGLAVALSYLAYLQALTFLLNILPVPGFDGYGVIAPHLSPRAQEIGAKARMWAPLVLFALVLGVRWVNQTLVLVGTAVFGLIGGDSDPAVTGGYLFRFWLH
ncbi:MAG: site-2 protease family protein, partial [Kutzneria sp.]|nr:site-2 protease family protein [Kutzneria sp.]